MAAFLRVAALRLRPWATSAMVATAGATAASWSLLQETRPARCDSAEPQAKTSEAPKKLERVPVEQIPKIRLPVAVYLPPLELYKIQLGLRFDTRIVSNRLVVSQAVAEQLKDFEGGPLELKLQYMVHDGLRRVISATLFHTDVFGDLKEVEGASAYLVVRDEREQVSKFSGSILFFCFFLFLHLSTVAICIHSTNATSVNFVCSYICGDGSGIDRCPRVRGIR